MKKIKFRLIALLLLGFLPFYSISQNGYGNLLVIAEPGFRVYIDEDFKGYTLEEQDGIFLENIPIGKRKITIKKSGNETKEANIEIKGGKTAEIDFNNLNSSAKKNNTLEDKSDFSEKERYYEQNSSGIFRDDRDSQTYNWVKIDGVIWMAENLNFKIVDSWCHSNDKSYCDKYGRLYIWESAVKACPEGWHLASDNEWLNMEKYLGMRESELYKEKERNVNVCRQLKATYEWSVRGYENGNNSSGFSALPNGMFWGDRGNFGWSNLYWTSTKITSYQAYAREFMDDIFRFKIDTENGAAVRCVRD